MNREFEDCGAEFNLLEVPMIVGLKDWRTWGLESWLNGGL
jgi:hypothetical protein